MIKKNEYINVPDVDFRISHSIDDSFIMNNCHFHNVFEIYFAQTDGLNFFINNQVFAVEKNDLFIFNNLDLHRIILPKGTKYERSIITFNPEYIKNLCTDSTNLLDCFINRNSNFSHRAKLSDESANTFKSFLEKSYKIHHSKNFGTDVYKKLNLAEILIFVNNIYKNNVLSVSAKSNEEYQRIKPILNYINNNISNKISLEILCRQFYVNKFHLCKLFKAGTGLTINEYVIFKRIILATELLRKNQSVSHVSEMTGFINECHFITTFRRIVGITPKQYAKKFHW